jgi:1-acyl-sn-glycerol-3-phosphate acyltransferase
VCIFPEGQTSWHGETQLIYMGMERLIKRSKCPLAMFNLCGNFLLKPWWARTKRSGRMLVTVKVLSAERIGELSDQELFDTIKQAIYHNDIKDERNLHTRFRGRDLAEGLERFVWRCMHCGAEDTLVTSGDSLTCTACNNTWALDAHCRLRPLTEGATCLHDLKDWADAHRAHVLDRIASAGPTDVLTSSSGVTLRTLEDDGYTFADRCVGSLSVTRSRLTFQPDGDSAKQHALSCAPDGAKDCVVQKKDIFELRYADTYYRFVFDHHSPMKWVYYLRYLNGYEELEKRGYL